MSLLLIKFKRLLCYFVGHSFNGFYLFPDEQNKQIMPTYFFCGKCKMILDVKKGWN
jgi:hypothetical protein